MTVFSADVQAARTVQAQLRLLQTTDLHMHVLPYDYYSDRPMLGTGLAHAAGLIERRRAEVANSLLFDCGDFLQGTPLGDYVAQDRGPHNTTAHPIIAAMNAAGYDAAVVGNHDFNYGLEFLQQALSSARFPVLAANVARQLGTTGPLEDRLLLPGHCLLRRQIRCADGSTQPLCVGVLGLTTPQITQWDQRHLAGRIRTRDIVETAAAWVPQLRALGAELVVVLAHTGFGAAEHVAGQENAALPLARLAGIDALMLGHNHLVFPAEAGPTPQGADAAAGRLHGTPAVMSGARGSHVGRIDLSLQRTAGRWKVHAADVQVEAVFQHDRGLQLRPRAAPHRGVLASSDADHRATLHYIRRPVGHSTAPLHSYFALLAHDPIGQVIAEAQRWHVARALADSAHAHLPLLSATAPFKTGGRGGPSHFTDVPAGALALRSIADLYHFPNRICAVRLRGAELCAWLERSAGAFNRLIAGTQHQPLLDAAFPGYNFDIIDGLEFEIDLAEPARYDAEGNLVAPGSQRIRNLAFQGAPLDPNAEFVVATNDFRAAGGGAFFRARSGQVVLESSESNRDILRWFVEQHGTLSPKNTPKWRFAPMPGTSAVFETGPGAARYLAEVKDLRLEPLGISASGFARYLIRF
ncbi:bifunctional 2',3'-cyclic-nucleotide 2'-phosphodiesterase/3'-nucleotidase [Phaeovulum sp.]|uniref:bifunctional 2',3'-cyclic-nucleotide 2'-phosphodiesterase/3'-nucleotidase n=1 Tax=Phaeovulum sp. TaxID=2934796 RepID=UPI003567DDF4